MRIPLYKTIRNGIHQTIKDQAYFIRDRLKAKPLWASQPLSLQLDRTNRKCSLRCIGCNPQRNFITKEGDLPLSTIKNVCEKLNKNHVRIFCAHPFMNSDPLRDPQLLHTSKILKKHLHCKVLVSTNGVLFNQRHLLRSPYLDWVAFTITGVDDASYNAFHRRPLFNSAVKTLYWLQNNKFWNQQIQVRYILYAGNTQNLVQWQKMFKAFPEEIRPLHFGVERAISKSLEQQNSIVDFYRKKQVDQFIKGEFPCNCFHDLAISFDGKLMQCCDLPYNLNYGHVDEIDLLETYWKRLDRGLDVEGCRTCNQKNPHWRELFEKYVG